MLKGVVLFNALKGLCKKIFENVKKLFDFLSNCRGFAWGRRCLFGKNVRLEMTC